MREIESQILSQYYTTLHYTQCTTLQCIVWRSEALFNGNISSLSQGWQKSIRTQYDKDKGEGNMLSPNKDNYGTQSLIGRGDLAKFKTILKKNPLVVLID